jgi:iron(III) transport system permease protein
MDIWSINAVLIAALVITPILSVFIIALTPTENIWPHLLSTTLPRYASNTLLLMFFVGLFSGIIGTFTAWLITRYRFFGSNWLRWALFLPLALPAYVASYALVDLLEYAGPVQSFLRSLFNWQTSQDYWFPEVRSLSSAIFVLSLALYPYVYLMARSAFLEQSDSAEEVAKSLGISVVGRFFRLGLPLARPAVFAGIALVMMEAASDFGAVDFFAVQTLTTGIFSVWLESNNAGGAAQIASTVLILIFILVSLEKYNQRKLRFYNLSYRYKKVEKTSLNHIKSLIAFSVCFLPIFFGFILPFLVLLNLGYGNLDLWINASLISAIKNTLLVSGLAAFVTVTLALMMVYGIRLSGKKLPLLILPLTTIGYAAPGAVLGIGILVPLALLDNWLADRVFDLTGYDPGLIFTGTAIAIILAYCVRFFSIAQQTVDGALGRVSPSLPNAARSLGRNKLQVLWEIYRPLISASTATALLLVFVDCVKELPATMLLRPFNFETLATRVHVQASLEDLPNAAPGAILIVSIGLCAVFLLARVNKQISS